MRRRSTEVLLTVALLPLLLAIGIALGWVVLDLQPAASGLTAPVSAHLAASGVANPVTAVLINFRGYDTLLEIGVLTLAVLGIWSVAVMPHRRIRPAGLVLTYLVRLVVPFMVLLAGYLLWVGAEAPGGAFQGGAVLAAAGVLVVLSGAPLPPVGEGWVLRGTMVLGLVTFTLVGVAMLGLGRRFLEFPPDQAKVLMVAIEAAATVSIAAILVSAFRGGRPRLEAPA